MAATLGYAGHIVRAERLGEASLLPIVHSLAPSLTSVIEDSNHLLRTWSSGDRASISAALRSVLSKWFDAGQRHFSSADAVIAAHAAGFGPLLDLCVEVRAIDRGDSVSRLLALLVLDSASVEDWMSVAMAGAYVRISAENSRRRLGRVGGDVLSEMVAAYLRNHPGASTAELFAHVKALELAGHMALEAAEDPETIEYMPNKNSIATKVLDRIGFAKRVYQVRGRVRLDC